MQMKYKVYVDGQEGTTGLEIFKRLEKRDDIEILKIDSDKRKDADERKKFLNTADIVFLCLPDTAAKEAVALINNPAVRVIDASTAHRTDDDWAYGIPELGDEFRNKIKTSKRVANPGCFASGFNILLHPLIKNGFVPNDYPVTCHSVTGYSGGGRKLIEIYESGEHKDVVNSPCFYSLDLTHKHLPEMHKHSGLKNPPLFTPIVCDYYRGMTVVLPFYTANLNKNITAAEIHEFYTNYYIGQQFIKVMPLGIHKELEWGYLNAESCNETNSMEIFVFGNETHILTVARFDNLGKGASGAAVQNLNIMLGLDDSYSLT